jgi:tetratricopeptide (TPR) repeat protein
MHTLLMLAALAGPMLDAGRLSSTQGEDPLVLVQRGRRLVTDGKHAEAIVLYKQALAARPELPEAHLAMGIVLDLMGRYGEARDHLTTAIENAPADLKANALSAMAVSYVFERRAADAAGFYQQVYDLDVDANRPAGAAATANALGRLYLETGDTRKARQWYETGYEMARRQPAEPASQLALWELRWLHAQGRIAAREGRAADARRFVDLYTGDVATARKELATASQTDPFNLMLMAEAAEKAGDAAAAKDYWSRILALNGHGIQHALSRPVALRRLQK